MAIYLPSNISGGMYTVTDDDVARWQTLYPEVDVTVEMWAMVAWLEANPKRRKTWRGMPRFISGWLGRARQSVKKPGSWATVGLYDPSRKAPE